MKPVQVTPPAAEPVTLGELKEHAQIDHSDNDTILEGMLSVAVRELDGYDGLIGRAIMEQTWRQPFRAWSRTFQLPMPGARDVSVTYVDQDGNEQTVDPALYEVVEGYTGSMVRLLSGFTAPSLKTDILQPINVTFTCGATSADEVDDRIKLAIKIIATHREHHRSVTTDAREALVPMGVSQLIAPLRWRSGS